MLELVFEICFFTRKTSAKQFRYYFFLGGQTDIIFGLFRQLSALFKKSSFAALVNMRQKF